MTIPNRVLNGTLSKSIKGPKGVERLGSEASHERRESDMLTTSFGSFDLIKLALGLAWPVVAVTVVYYAYRAFRCFMTSRKSSSPPTSTNAPPLPSCSSSPGQGTSRKTPVDMRRIIWWATFCGVNATALAISAQRKTGPSLPYMFLALLPLLFSLLFSGWKFYGWTHYDREFPGRDEEWIGGIALLLFLIGLIALWIM